MDVKQLVQASLNQADFFVGAYLGDLSEEEMRKRVAPGANHIAWQLGHLIQSEDYLINKLSPGETSPLPADFSAKHKKDTAANEDPAAFYSKEEYLGFAKAVREKTLRVLDSLGADDFDKPAGPGVPPFVKTVGDLIILIPNHWIQHAGQWVALRRTVGKTGLF